MDLGTISRAVQGAGEGQTRLNYDGIEETDLDEVHGAGAPVRIARTALLAWCHTANAGAKRPNGSVLQDRGASACPGR